MQELAGEEQQVSQRRLRPGPLRQVRLLGPEPRPGLPVGGGPPRRRGGGGFADERDFDLQSPGVSRAITATFSKGGGKEVFPVGRRKDHAWIWTTLTGCEFVGGDGGKPAEDDEAKSAATCGRGPPAPPPGDEASSSPGRGRSRFDKPSAAATACQPCAVLVNYPLMYLTSINYVKSIKCTSAPFQEASPMLSDISSLPSWDKVASGLLKLWEGEVVGKRVVVQHFTFGEVFKKVWTVEGTDFRQGNVAMMNRGGGGGVDESALSSGVAGGGGGGGGVQGADGKMISINRDECLSPWGNMMHNSEAAGGSDPTGRAPWAKDPDFGTRAPWMMAGAAVGGGGGGGGGARMDEGTKAPWARK